MSCRGFRYTDDISLLCPSRIKKMLFLCEQYVIDYKIMFNSKKSKFMCFQKIVFFNLFLYNL